MEELVARYGYAAVFIGTLVEAETMLVLGGFAAHQGLLRLDLVMLCGFAGSWLGDLAIFLVARRKGPGLLARHPRLEAAERPVARLVARWGNAFAVGFRFVYGMRTLGPIAIALAGMGTARFAVLGALGAGGWAAGVATLGFLFGRATAAFFGRGRAAELELVIGLALAAATVAAAQLRRYVHRRRSGSRHDAQ